MALANSCVVTAMKNRLNGLLGRELRRVEPEADVRRLFKE